MKKTNLVEYRNMATNSISAKITELQKEIADKRMDKAMGKMKDHKEIWKLKKSVAVMFTILNQKLVLESIENEKGAE